MKNVRSLSIAALLLATSSVMAASFNDSANVNALRQYGTGGAFLVPHTNTTTGSFSIARDNDAPFANNPNDGSQWNVETDNGFDTAADTWTQTFTLGGPNGGSNFSGAASTVSSFSAEWDGNRWSSSFVLDYSNDNTTWTNIGAYTPTGDIIRQGFAPVTAKYIRYTAIGGAPQASNIYGLSEFKVWMETGQTIAQNRGYNILNDLRDAGKAGAGDSTTVGPWTAPNGGGAADMSDELVNAAETKAQNNAGKRAYLIYHFDQQYQLDLGTLGGSKGQGWSNLEVYTINGSSNLTQLQSSLDGLSGATTADITGAGWTLQAGSVAPVAGGNAFDFLLSNPGDWQNVLVVWNAQGGGMRELELAALPEPTSLALLGVAGLGLIKRRVRSAAL